MKNLYLVVSAERVYKDAQHYPPEPPEEYYIAELVVADSRGQAKWLAWKNDKNSFSPDIRDMPRFKVRKKYGYIPIYGESRICSNELSLLNHFCIDYLWDLGEEDANDFGMDVERCPPRV